MVRKLTQRERTVLEHLKRAQERGETLSDYAVALNLNVKDLYNGRAQLRRKGALSPTARVAQLSEPKLFAVQVKEPQRPPITAEWACRLISPEGWVMECRQLPDIAWLRELSASTTETNP